jgi:probable HAF family extracellular repeat protein
MFACKSVVRLPFWLVLASPLAVLAAPTYTVTLLSGMTDGHGIDASGRVAGSNLAQPFTHHAAIWARGRVYDIGTRFGGESVAMGMSDNGAVVGYASGVDDPSQNAFLYWHGRIRKIGTLGGSDSFGYAINNRLQVAGDSFTTTGAKHAFLYEDGKIRDLGTLGGSNSSAHAINNFGVVVGDSYIKDEPQVVIHAFLYREGKMHDLGTLPGGTYSSATAINDEGMVAGQADVPGAIGNHAFIYRYGVMRDIGSFGGNTEVAGINNHGQVVGTSAGRDGSWRGFLYIDGRLEDLNKLLVPGCSWRVEQASAINDAGQIVAFIRRGDQGYFARLDPSGQDRYSGQGARPSIERNTGGCP